MARSAGCPSRDADKKCSLRCGCGQKCNNGKNEGTKRDNAQRLSDRLFDCHGSEIQQSEVEIKVNYGHSRGNENEHSCFSQQEMSSTHVRAHNVMRRPVNFLALPL